MDFLEFTAGIDDNDRRIDKVLRKLIKNAPLSSIYKYLRNKLVKINRYLGYAWMTLCVILHLGGTPRTPYPTISLFLLRTVDSGEGLWYTGISINCCLPAVPAANVGDVQPMRTASREGNCDIAYGAGAP